MTGAGRQAFPVVPDAEASAWVRLLGAPQVGRGTARRLLTAFGSPEAVLAAGVDARRAVVGPAVAEALDAPSSALDAQVAATLAWRQADAAGPRTLVPLGDPLYPPLLLQTADPPLLLYVLGDVALLQAPAVAIVGSRNPTPQGRENAAAFGRHLSDAGLVVVSGLALGIDTAAHEGALAGATPTVAVVGTGLDRVYPRRNLALARQIAAGGAIVSEFPLGTPPLPPHFPMRNRIIAGLAEGTLVVEAALRSGSLVTARMAVEANREVFAVPGSIHSPQSRGCHALIRQGAKLVESAVDILEELRPGPRLPAAAETGGAAPPEDDDPVLAVLGFDPATLDALAGRTGLSAAELAIRLLDLELEGRVARLPGQRFQRIRAA